MEFPALEGVSLLEQLRVDKGLSQQKAAFLAGISHKTLKKYEQEGIHTPIASVLQKLGHLYGVRASLIAQDVKRLHREREEALARQLKEDERALSDAA